MDSLYGAPMELIALFSSTVAYRPYVFVFLALYLLVSWRMFGALRTLLFTALVWLTAFASEYSSTRNGFPFGDYVYLEVTRDRELWIANVPFMDSLSFTFLAFVSYALALAFCLPLGRSDRSFVRLIDVPQVRRSWGVWCLAVLFFVWLDVVIDPVAVRGDRWFLGRIFYYPDDGVYFGVPLSNFAGWAFVGGVSIRLFQWCDRWWFDRPARPLLSAAWLYYLVLGFNLAVTFWIGELQLGLVGVFIHVPVLMLLLVRVGQWGWSEEPHAVEWRRR